MTTNQSPGPENGLRRRAEATVGADSGSDPEALTTEQMRRLLHEVRVHQAELEMQNEELRRTQHELELSRERYFELYDLAPVGYLTVSENGLILNANLTSARLLDVARATMLQQPLSGYVHSDDQDSFYLLRKQLQENGSPQSIEIRMKRSGGSSFRAQLQASPSRDGACLITLADISELWQARLEMLKKQKIESLGILAGGIAHDFNNILSAILGNIVLAKLQLGKPETARSRLEDAEKAIDRATGLARQLLTFAKGGEPVKKTIDVRAILKEAAGFALLGSNVKCVLSLDKNLNQIEADEGQISQVIHNLVLNAVHAMPEGGTIRVSAENVSSSQSGKPFVRFSIADTGIGISEQNLLKVFDPYFTTKAHGSGLGLATCYSIIKKHGGKIRAASLPGKGSTFTISLPACRHEPVSVPEERTAPTPGSGRVLVMDDEQMIRDIARMILTELGYTVECAANGSEALKLYLKRKEAGSPFDVVILDLTVPGGPGGLETINRLMEIDPDVKAVVCSGYSDSPVLANYRDYGFRGVLCKPFQLEELSGIMQQLLKAG